MPSPTANLLDALMENYHTEERPWGFMHWLDAPSHDLTVKYMFVARGSRTSLQQHQRKDELLIVLFGSGYIEVGAERHIGMARIRPGVPHRVTGELSYLEVSTYDDDTDTTRLEDDYGRA